MIYQPISYEMLYGERIHYLGEKSLVDGFIRRSFSRLYDMILICPLCGAHRQDYILLGSQFDGFITGVEVAARAFTDIN